MMENGALLFVVPSPAAAATGEMWVGVWAASPAASSRPRVARRKLVMGQLLKKGNGRCGSAGGTADPVGIPCFYADPWRSRQDPNRRRGRRPVPDAERARAPL